MSFNPIPNPLGVTQSGGWTVTLSGTSPVSGTVTANLGTIAGVATEATLAALNAKVTEVNTGAVVLAAGAATIGTVNVAGTVPVSGTFWQATQPVSIAGTVAVSGPLTDTQLRATAVPVSLTSTTITGTVTTTGPLTDTQLRASAVPVSLTSTTITGTVATNASLQAGSAIVGKFGIDQTTPGTTNKVSIGTDGTVAINAALPIGANTIGTTTGPTLTKGTQGASGYSVQDLKDAGRVIFSAATVIAGVTAVTTEALLTMVPTRDGVAATTATSHAVTSGKRLRITSMTAGFISTAAAVLSMRFALRMNPSGAVTATSPILRIIPVSQQAAALAQAGNEMTIDFPDGIEFSGTHQIGVTQIGSAATGTCWVSLTGFEY